uniref:N-acetyltransferase domain-containing protein n=1 Tax=Strigamia maritima TaxID=126957 RepID=T1J5P7_STRMM
IFSQDGDDNIAHYDICNEIIKHPVSVSCCKYTNQAEMAAYCYCKSSERDHFMIYCQDCHNYFHPNCLKSGSPSPLVGDIFFHFRCKNCASEEQCIRMKLQWAQIIIIALYNLKLQANGREGYYRYKDDICPFIDKHWNLLFGPTKKKTSTWHGTVAGTLSNGGNSHFTSGQSVLNESGWWALTDPNNCTVIQEIENSANLHKFSQPRRESPRIKSESPVKNLRSRVSKPPFQAAVELKEKRSSFVQTKRAKRSSVISATVTSPAVNSHAEENKEGGLWFSPTKIKKEPSEVSYSDSSTFDWDHRDESTDSWFTEKDLKPNETLPQCLLKDDEENLDDIEIDSGSSTPITMANSPQFEDIMSFVDDSSAPTKTSESAESKTVDSVSDAETTTDVPDVRPSKRKKYIQEEETKPEPITICQPLSVYEEKLLLKKLESMPQAVAQSVQARRLRRKLIVRQQQREWNVPVFDIDTILIKSGLIKLPTYNRPQNSFMKENMFDSVSCSGDYRVLDRFQLKRSQVKNLSQQRPLFLTRLIGKDENHLEGIISPYTERTLKPFIWRDYQSTPPKLNLLQEIIAYPHRKSTTWTPPSRSPIDYSYVRPDHIPSINALCREFFWPGIDLSECLQYPDFSCVALYKWMIIGFAIMVPDVKWNEAYISFVFTHPDWRGAGIATFMIYHLLQTCMGKDVTLHVSATNPAMLLYQKFGFKVEEYIVDFYDKYYSDDYKECKHAFFLRLHH